MTPASILSSCQKAYENFDHEALFTVDSFEQPNPGSGNLRSGSGRRHDGDDLDVCDQVAMEGFAMLDAMESDALQN